MQHIVFAKMPRVLLESDAFHLDPQVSDSRRKETSDVEVHAFSAICSVLPSLRSCCRSLYIVLSNALRAMRCRSTGNVNPTIMIRGPMLPPVFCGQPPIRISIRVDTGLILKLKFVLFAMEDVAAARIWIWLYLYEKMGGTSDHAG